jgi:glucosamine--fructose-6-phosphate aminotransferase (isomerizing)
MIEQHDGLDLMTSDIERQAGVIRSALPAIRAAATSVAREIEERPARAYLVGCGDSLDAGIAARGEWERLLGIPVEAVPAMTFSMSRVDEAPAGSLVVALSQSGRVSRVIEAVRAARARGLRTVAVTASPSSPLGGEPADARLVIPFQKLGPIPGTTSHLLGTLAMYELGCALADDGAADALLLALDEVADAAESAAERTWSLATEHAEAFTGDTRLLALGYGAGLAPARYATRKFLETSQIVALWQETEEYAHDEYSLVDDSFQVVQFSPPDRGLGRSLEIARYLQRLDVGLAVVTTEGTGDRFRGAGTVYELPRTALSVAPIVYAVVGQILGVGGSLYGMAERVHREDGDPQIYESALVSPERRP